MTTPLRFPAFNLRFTALPAAGAALEQLLAGDRPAPRGVWFEGRQPIPLLTGPRGRRRRVDHARALRMATWARRRQRRHGIPAATVWFRTYLPAARVELLGSTT